MPDLSHEPDLDAVDLQDYKFVTGDIITLYHRKRDDGEQWRVGTVLDEILGLQSLEAGKARNAQ